MERLTERFDVPRAIARYPTIEPAQWAQSLGRKHILQAKRPFIAHEQAAADATNEGGSARPPDTTLEYRPERQ